MAKSRLFLLIAAVSVTVFREGKQENVKAGTPFEFEAGEVLDILRAQPGSLRHPINETKVDGEEGKQATEAELIAEATKQAEEDRKLLAAAAAKAPAKGGTGRTGSDEL